MGQQHQAYLIAQILSTDDSQARYKCVAAIHHQWCYGRLPLQAARRFITLAEQDPNARIICAELDRLSTIDFRKIKQPSHYLATLLAIAFHYGFEEQPGYVSVTGPEYGALPAYKRIDETDNSDGITVIDITDPSHCTCVFTLGLGTSGTGNYYEFVSAEAYARTYYPEGMDFVTGNPDASREVEEDVKAVTASMKDVPLLSIQAVSEAWPEEIQPEGVRSPAVGRLSGEAAPQSLNDSSLPPLSDLALLPALKKAIETDNFDGIEQISWHPRRAKILLTMLRETADLQPISDKMLLFISKLFIADRSNSDNSEVLDLSHLQLSPEQICSLLQENLDIQVLDLSHNPLVDVQAMKTILEAAPPIRKLIILDTATSSQDWTDLLRDSPDLFKHFEAIIHPSFFNFEAKFQPQLLFCITGDPLKRETNCSALPFFTPPQIFQGIQVLFKLLEDETNLNLDFFTSTLGRGIAPAVALSAETLRPGARWAERGIPFLAPKSFGRIQISETNWAFVVHLKKAVYAFLDFGRHCPPNGLGYVVHDIKSFLQKMDDEGRAQPDPVVVNEVQRLFQDVVVTGKYLLDEREATVGLRVMDAQEAEEIVLSLIHTKSPPRRGDVFIT